MRVRDLRLLLDMLPDDMLVCIDAPFGLKHVTEARKVQRGTIPGYGDVPARARVPTLRLSSSRGLDALWMNPEPPFRIRGRWPRPRAKDAELAALLRAESASPSAGSARP